MVFPDLPLVLFLSSSSCCRLRLGLWVLCDQSSSNHKPTPLCLSRSTYSAKGTTVACLRVSLGARSLDFGLGR